MKFSSISFALARARTPILVVAALYVVSITAGILMVHSGNEFALDYRDRLVSRAQTGVVLTQQNPALRGVLDFGGNSLAAAGDTLLGLGIVTPYPMVVYRGWVGGIVSVDAEHDSRLAQPKEAAYYISVICLQLLGYSLAAGAGIYLGLETYRSRPKGAGFWWFKIPRQAGRDVLLIYTLILPVFFIASMWEFLSPWN
jgi:hypothetical protein